MSFRGNHRPGQGFKPFKILKRVGGVSKSHRPGTARLECQGEFYGMISQASPREVEQWKQSGHPISHTIVQYGSQNNAVETDIIELNEPGSNKAKTRKFLVQAVRDPGGLGHTVVYKVEERVDLG